MLSLSLGALLLCSSATSFAMTPLHVQFKKKARVNVFRGEILKAVVKVASPLFPLVGLHGVVKHTAKDFKKGWQMARTGVIQSKLGDALADGRAYQPKTGLRKARTAAWYFARGLTRIVMPHTLLFHAASSAWRNLVAGSEVLVHGASLRQQQLEQRASALKCGHESGFIAARGSIRPAYFPKAYSSAIVYPRSQAVLQVKATAAPAVRGLAPLKEPVSKPLGQQLSSAFGASADPRMGLLLARALARSQFQAAKLKARREKASTALPMIAEEPEQKAEAKQDFKPVQTAISALAEIRLESRHEIASPSSPENFQESHVSGG